MTGIHVLFVIISLITVVIADEHALMWMLGKKQTLPAKRVEIFHVVTSLGIAGLLLTGGLMFMDRASYLLSDTTFLVKMGFVGALVINGFFIGAFSKVATTRTFASLSTKERLPLLISGAVSGIGWVGAVICGALL